MPDPREIERLKKNLRALAKEDEVLKARGDAYVDLPPPPEPEGFRDPNLAKRAAEFEDLPENGLGLGGPVFPPDEAGSALSEGDAAPDFSSLLQDMDFSLPDQAEASSEGGEGRSPEEPETAGIPEAGAAEEFNDFDLGAFAAQPEDFAAEENSGGADSEVGSQEGEGVPDFAAAFDAFASQSLGEPLAEPAEPLAEPAEALAEPAKPLAEAPVPEAISDNEPQEELFADEGLSQAEMAAAAEDRAEALPEIPAEADQGVFDIPSFDSGDIGVDTGNELDLGGDTEIKAAPAFDAGIQARADLGMGAPETGSLQPSPAPGGDAEEDPFASFDFNDENIMGSIPAIESAEEKPKDESAWGQGAVFGEFGSREGISGGIGGEGEPESEAGRISLTEKEVDRLQDSLLSYPLNLRLEIEQCIARDVLPEEQTAEIIKALVDGKSASETAALLGRFLKKSIRVPKGFERRTGKQFEDEHGTFWYAFKTNILPLIGIVGAIVSILAMVAFLGYNLVWKPLYADSIYRSGYRLIPEGDYRQSESLFDSAVKVMRVRKWYFRYAESYIEHKRYTLAEKKYEELLKHYRMDKKAAVDYARFESEILLAFEKAESILKSTILEWRPKDRDALLLLGDNYLAWADDLREGDARSEKLEGARKAFAALIRLYGRKDVYLGRMLVYFIRTGNMKEVLILKNTFLAKGKPVIDAVIYAELGGFLIDAANLEEVRAILSLGVRKDPALPDNHYQLARYFRATANPDEERKALKKSIAGFESLPALSRARLMAYIDSLNWSGDLHYANHEFLDAEDRYKKGIEVYENALAERRIEPSGRFGEMYADRADIYYYDRADYMTAFTLYQDAERSRYSTPETAYKRGFIRYRDADYKAALSFFYQASGDFTVSDNLLLSLANTLYYREDYSAASGYFLQLRDAMRDEIDRIEYQDPQNRPNQSRIVRLLMTTYNNLGVSLYHLANRGGDASRRAEAMASFTESLRLFDVMNRDQSTMIRPQGANLAFLNLDGILHPSRVFVPQIYPDISRDLVDSDEKTALDAALYAGKTQ